MTVWLAWAFDILTLFSTYLSPEQIAAQTIMRTVNMISFTIPIGFQISSCILIGKSIGEKNEHQAKLLFRIALTSSILFGALSILLLHRYQYAIFSLYTTDPTIVAALEETWHVFLFYLLLIQFQFVAAGAL